MINLYRKKPEDEHILPLLTECTFGKGSLSYSINTEEKHLGIFKFKDNQEFEIGTCMDEFEEKTLAVVHAFKTKKSVDDLIDTLKLISESFDQ